MPRRVALRMRRAGARALVRAHLALAPFFTRGPRNDKFRHEARLSRRGVNLPINFVSRLSRRAGNEKH